MLGAGYAWVPAGMRRLPAATVRVAGGASISSVDLALPRPKYGGKVVSAQAASCLPRGVSERFMVVSAVGTGGGEGAADFGDGRGIPRARGCRAGRCGEPGGRVS